MVRPFTYLFIYLFTFYLIFVYLIDFIQSRRKVLELSQTYFAQFLARSIAFPADWPNALGRFPIN